MTECTENGCTEPAGVKLRIPWAADRAVCPAHARVIAQQDGIVAEPLDDAADHWQ